MPDLLQTLGSALIPLTTFLSLSIYLSTHPASPFRRKRIALPTHQDEPLEKDDAFDVWDADAVIDGRPVDPEPFWAFQHKLKVALLVALILPFAANVALLAETIQDDATPQILLIPAHVATISLVLAFLRQRDTPAHWSTTVHLSVGIFVQFIVLSTLALWPNEPFPEARFLVLGGTTLPPLIPSLRALVPVLHLPPLLIVLFIRRGPPLYLPLSVIYPPKVIDSIPLDHPSLDPSRANLCEEVQCTVPEYLLYGYATNIVKKGYVAETMDVWDLPVLTAEMRALPLYRELKRIYSRPTKLTEGYAILWKVAKANTGYLVAQQVLAFAIAFAYYLPHWLLQQLLEYLQRDPARTVPAWGWLIAFGLFTSNALVYIGSGMIWSISSTTLQGRIRLQLNTLLFSKTLRKKDVAGGAEVDDDDEEATPKSKSQIMTLFTVDVDRVTDFVFHAFALVDSPVELAVATFYLLQLLGRSAIYGLLTSILLLPVNHFASKFVVTAQEELMKSRDKRAGLMTEILGAIRMVKFQAWERPFEKRVQSVRDTELHWQKRTFTIEVAFNVLWEISPVLVTVVSFLHYTLVAGHTLTPATAFTSLAVFAELRYALNALPETFINVIQGFVSCRRIEQYLALPEVEVQKTHAGSGDIVLEDATFTWPKDGAETGFSLANLSIRFPRGELSLVCGRLGSGKTLLLNGLLGEADLVAGRVDCPRSLPNAMDTAPPGGEWIVQDMVAYVPQQAWLQNASIRDNIVFSSPWDGERYQQVLEACSLISDLKILEDGDQTEIGEKGLNLSGGQKARVSLARAVYSRASVLLLDDVLSAVDAHTAHDIMDNCLTGEIVRGRTIILVSHHTALVSPAASFIVALENGDVQFSGTRAEFVECGLMDALDEKAPTSPVAEKTAEQALGHAQHKSVTSLQQGSPDPGSETSSLYEDEDTLGSEGDAEGKSKDKAPRKLVEDEKRATGRIAWPVWKTYFSALGGWLWWILFVFTLTISLALPVAEKGWLAKWTGSDPSAPGTPSPTYFISVFAIITLGGGFATEFVTAVMYYGSLRASRLLHGRMLGSVLFAKLRFHDTTSRGRLINRFTKDLEGLDSKMGDNFARSIEYGLAVCVTFVSIASVGGMPFVAVGCAILLVYWQVGKIYGQTSRDMRRLDSVTRSPLYSLFGETVAGVGVLRAFGSSTIALKHMMKLADTNMSPFWAVWTVNRWLSARFNLLSSILVGLTAVIVLISGVDAAKAGFALAFAQTISHDLLFVVRRFVQLEQSMVALERIKEYSELDLEAPEFVEPRPPANWPHDGEIRVEDLVIRYAPDLPDVLHSVSFEVRPREKVGIVGATGCGKSTLALSFFRFVEAHAGRIVIDDIDISKIGLTDLRSRVTIIPQDPTLLSGTLRSTLDVFDEYDDAELYAALRRVHLITEDELLASRAASTADLGAAAAANGDGEVRNKNTFRDLQSVVQEGGDNFSSGEKQLLAMARAILKRNKLLMLDEATASIDYETDALISQTIREEFSDSTILTIAHRLSTIIDFDKVLVMHEGRVAEYASPAVLLRDHKSRFYALCRATGKSEFRALKQAAMDAERKREGRK